MPALSNKGTGGGGLAINGGTPVRSSILPYARQQIEEDDINTVVDVLRSDFLTTGPKVEEFERCVADYVGAEFAVAYSSGTAALHGAAFAAGLGPGDEAITTPMTFCATANCVVYMGATPVFADVCTDNLNIDPDQIAAKITPKTKAILPVDYAGHAVALDEILELANKHGLVVIEDAAHALGGEYKSRKVGSISHMTMFSFHPVKHIATGEGGMITTNDPELNRKLRRFRNHGIERDSHQRQAAGDWHYEMVDLGYNYRLPDLNCALGTSQMARLPQNLENRRQIADRYFQAFSAMPGLVLPIQRPDSLSAWHLYPLRFQLDRFAVGRKELFQAVRAENIGVNVHYIPVHLHPYYREQFGFTDGDYPNAEAGYESLITIPMFHAMTAQEQDEVIEAVNKVVSHYFD